MRCGAFCDEGDVPVSRIRNLKQLDTLIDTMRCAARVPGTAVAVVAEGEIKYAKGFGYRDLDARLPVTTNTVYPIASTSKALNATVLGMLVDESRLSWDAPVQRYLPGFRLHDSLISPFVTVRDLVTMRTGLPRHDWSRMEELVSRKELVERLRYLELSAGFRERFQYNNLTVTAAGHIAEVVAGRSWEELVQERIFTPLRMNNSGFSMPTAGDFTLSYHETSRRELKVTRRLATEVTAPSGGAIHSTINDMARWMLFNLDAGEAAGRSLIRRQTLLGIHSPQIVVGPDPAARKPNSMYAMGWTVDTYNGSARVSHGGYLHDINSEVTLFPNEGIGVVSFTNFGPPMVALPINEHVSDLIMGRKSLQSLEWHLAQYEKKIKDTRARNVAACRIENTSPSHSLDDYAGVYVHPGYGRIQIRRDGAQLIFQRNNLTLTLQHWHYDAWICEDSDLFEIHQAHPFDRASRWLFDTDVDGEIAGLSIPLEPTVAPIHFAKQ